MNPVPGIRSLPHAGNPESKIITDYLLCGKFMETNSKELEKCFCKSFSKILKRLPTFTSKIKLCIMPVNELTTIKIHNNNSNVVKNLFTTGKWSLVEELSLCHKLFGLNQLFK